jgi:hypothetical protein
MRNPVREGEEHATCDEKNLPPPVFSQRVDHKAKPPLVRAEVSGAVASGKLENRRLSPTEIRSGWVTSKLAKWVKSTLALTPIKDHLTKLYKNVCFELRKHTYDRNSSPPPDPFSKAYEFFNDASTNIYEPYYQSRLEEVGLSQPPSDEQRPDELKKIVVPEDLDTYSQPILIDNKHLVHQDCYFFRPRQGFSKKASYTDGHNRDEIGFKKNQWIKATRNQKLCVVFEVTPGIYHFFRKVDVVALSLRFRRRKSLSDQKGMEILHRCT